MEPKSQCRACLTYWDAGIVYCTCGHFLRDDTTEKQEVHLVRAGSLLYSELLHQEGPTTRSQVRMQRIPHGKNNFKEGVERKHYENIHDRFISDKWFRKTLIELGRSEEVILEMYRLASEDDSYIATQEEIDVYRGNWWIRSNLVNFDTIPTRHRLDFKKALSTLHRLKKAEDKAHYEHLSQSSSSWWQWQTGGIPIMRLHHKDGLNTDRTGKPV